MQAIICDHVEDPALDKALEDLAVGRRPFGIFSMFKGGLKAKVEIISIEGRPPSNPEDWRVIRSYRSWQLGALLTRVASQPLSCSAQAPHK